MNLNFATILVLCFSTCIVVDGASVVTTCVSDSDCAKGKVCCRGACEFACGRIGSGAGGGSGATGGGDAMGGGDGGGEGGGVMGGGDGSIGGGVGGSETGGGVGVGGGVAGGGVGGGSMSNFDAGLRDAGVRTGENCSTAVVVDLPTTGGSFVANDSLDGVNDLELLDCTPAFGADRVYAVVVPVPMLVVITVSSTGSAPPGLSLYSSACASAQWVACGSFGSTPTIDEVLNPGRYFVIVERATGGDVDFTLNVTGRPVVAGDRCEVATPMSFVGPVASVSGSLRDAGVDYSSEVCASSDGGVDRFFTFPVVQGDEYGVTIMGAEGAILSQYCSALTACVPMNGMTTIIPTTTGVQTLMVRGPSSANFTATVTRSTRVPGDSCAAPITLSGNAVGSLASARSDYSLSCVMPAPDVVYRVPVSSPSSVTVDATASGGGSVGVSLRSTCGPGTDLACGVTPTSLGPITSAVPVYVFVSGSASSFSLQSTVTPIPGESCAAPKPLALSSMNVSDTTAGRYNDRPVTSPCGVTGGGDVVFTFTLPVTKLVHLELDPVGSWFPVLSIQGACSPFASSIACAGPLTSSTKVTLDQTLDAGTYYVWVDSALPGQGAFNLKGN